MKSSTLRRSNLSKERMLVLEELSKNKKKPYDASPGVYVRAANKEKELDVLWQNFRVNNKEDKSSGVYFITGFVAGAIVMLIITTLLSFSVQNNNSGDIVAPVAQQKEKAKLTFIPADKAAKQEPAATTTKAPESYTIKNGDTLAGIIIRFYGKYDVSKIEKIRAANNMSNANNLKIGQQLIIPMD